MDTLKVIVVAQGDPSVGIPSHSFEMDLGIVPKDVNTPMRRFIRGNLTETFGEIYQRSVSVHFSDEETMV